MLEAICLGGYRRFVHNVNDDKDKVLEEVMSYYSLKKLLSAKLNRVV